MSKKARLTENELELLAKAALECPGGTAQTVLVRYTELGGRHISRSSVEKKLAIWRHERKIPPATASTPREERPLGMEAPWSLGISAKPEYGITPEATADLLAVWNLCIAIGHVFTIREARWVVRLRTAVIESKGRIGELFAFAYEYAIRERICGILNKEIDTRDLDGLVGIENRERFIYYALGLIPRPTIPFHERETEKAYEFYSYLAESENPARNIALANIPKTLREDSDAFTIAVSFTKNLPPEQARIYTSLLLYLTKGSKWNALSIQMYNEILSKLRKCVTEGIPQKRVIDYVVLDFNRGLKPADFLNSSLLEIVGYQVSTNVDKEA